MFPNAIGISENAKNMLYSLLRFHENDRIGIVELIDLPVFDVLGKKK